MGIYKNTNVINSLPGGTRESVFAMLTEYNADPTKEIKVWEFMMNPQTLSYGGNSDYAASGTFAAREQEQQFINSGNQTLTIPDIVLDSYHENKSSEILLDGLEELRKAKISESKFSPIVLSFVWGKKRFAPCGLTSIEWVENGWLGGDVAKAKLRISLLKFPTPGKLGLQNIALELIAMQLTERQLADASNAVNQYLKDNTALLSPTVQNLVRSGQYKITTDRETAIVTVTDTQGKTIGVAGTYSKGIIDPSTSTLIVNNGN